MNPSTAGSFILLSAEEVVLQHKEDSRMKLQPVPRRLSDTSPLLFKQAHAVWYNKSIVFTLSLGLIFCRILLCIIIIIIIILVIIIIVIIIVIVIIIIIIIIVVVVVVVVLITCPILFALKCRALYHYPSHQPRNASVKSHEIQQPPCLYVITFPIYFQPP